MQHTFLLVVAVGANAASTHGATCSAAANQRSLFGKGIQPIQEFSVRNITSCCSACVDSTNSTGACGAWFVKWPPVTNSQKSNKEGVCKLYNVSDVALLQYGNCSAFSKPAVCSASIFGVQPNPPPNITSVVNITVSRRTPNDQWVISHYLAAMSFVYCWAPDRVYSNGTMVQWARKNNVATARYPAGTASYWDWEHPSGNMGMSALDPSYNASKAAPPENWMNMSEYLDLCSAIQMRPLIGVNYNCHAKYFVSQNDSIARAVRQVEYVVARGFRGAFYYIGNEDGASIPAHTEQIANHARAMKQVDPTIKIFWNDNDLNAGKIANFLKITGPGVMDGAEFHGKWPYGGTPPLRPATFDQWLTEAPLMERKSRTLWRDRIAPMRKAAAAAGQREFLLANNEYGLGKPSNMVGFNRFTKSLVNIEFAMELFIGGYDMAALWDNGDGQTMGTPRSNNSLYDQMLLDTDADFRMNPVHFGLELLFTSVNTSMLAFNTTAPRVHGFCSEPPSRVHAPAHASAPNHTCCFLINKIQVDVTVHIRVPADLPRLSQARSVEDTSDHWGRLTDTSARMQVVQTTDVTVVYAVTLPSLSFTALW
eukprot:m.1224826 g.1224826  ORF g.1224826 m.1224826 type:complete len:595 (+) comp24627_c0_seq9:70-1854(+)